MECVRCIHRYEHQGSRYPFEDPNGGVWAQDANGHLRQFYYTNGTWTAFDVSNATGVNISGNPFVDTGGGVWARDTNNHLWQFYVNGSWTAADITGATGTSIHTSPTSGSNGEFAGS